MKRTLNPVLTKAAGLLATLLLMASVAFATDYYVSNSGSDGNSGLSGAPKQTIQAAINVAASGDFIHVDNGTYNERVTVTKSLTIQGASKTGTIVTGTGLIGVGSGFYLNNGVTNVTIRDITIENFSGSSPNLYAGIYAVGGNHNLTVMNTLIRNNVGGSGIYANGPVNDVALDGNTIYGHTNAAGPARGIVIWNGLKSNISITNNEVFNNNCCGIELQDGTATGVTMSGNNVHDNVDNGIGLVGLQGPDANLISTNTLSNNGRFGIEVKLPNGSGQTSGPGSIVISGNNVSRPPVIVDQRDIAGIAVYRRGWVAGNNNVNIPTGVVVSNNTVSGYRQSSTSDGFGIVVEGTNHTVTSNTVSNNDVGIQRQAGHPTYNPANLATDGIQDNLNDAYFGRGNSPFTCAVALTGNTFSGNTTNTRDVGNASGNGFVTNTNSGKTFCSIQAAISDAATQNGHVLVASAGTFDENITISKSITLRGANYNVPCPNRSGSETIINGMGSGTIAVEVTTDGVTINGLTIVNQSGSYGVRALGRSNIDIQYNIVTNIGNAATGSGTTFGIYHQTNAAAVSDVNVSNNCISQIRGGGTTGSGNGIGFGHSPSQGTITGIAVNGNTISNVSAYIGTPSGGGKGAYGILISPGASPTASGKAVNALVSNNSITNLEGRWVHGVGLEGETPGAQIINNSMDGFVHHSPVNDAAGVRIEANDGAGTVQIHENSFTNMAFGVVNVMPQTVNATCNWYGTTSIAGVAAKNAGNVEYSPWLSSGADANPSAIGFQPAGDCDGDNEQPEMVCPQDANIACGASTLPSNTGVATAPDKCGAPVTVISSDGPSSGNCLCNYSFVRTWTATDACGNTSTCEQTITVSGDEPACSISATAPANSAYTGGVPSNIYIGHGAQSVLLTANGGSFASYEWTGPSGTLSCTTCANPVFTPNAATTNGSYPIEVEVTNSYGCKTTCVIEVCVRDIRVPNNNGKVYVCHNGNTLAINSNAVPAHFPGHTGDQLGACNMLPCSSASGSGRMANNENQNVGELIVDDELEMAVYPNPTNTEFNIRIESISTDFADVRVLDLSGRIVERAPAVQTNTEVTLGRNLSPGVYFVEVRHGDLSKKIKVVKL